MIPARSPLRITLGGGGTDLPSYYREHGGFLIAAAIDQYVCVTLHETFLQQMLVRYSQIEWVSHRSDVTPSSERRCGFSISSKSIWR